MRSERGGERHRHVALGTAGPVEPLASGRMKAESRLPANAVSLLRLSVPARLFMVAIAAVLSVGCSGILVEAEQRFSAGQQAPTAASPVSLATVAGALFHLCIAGGTLSGIHRRKWVENTGKAKLTMNSYLVCLGYFTFMLRSPREGRGCFDPSCRTHPRRSARTGYCPSHQ